MGLSLPRPAEEKPRARDRVRQGRWGPPGHRASLPHPPPRSPEVQLLPLQTLVRSMPDPMRGSPSSSISSAGGEPRDHPQSPPRRGPPNLVIVFKRLPQVPASRALPAGRKSPRSPIIRRLSESTPPAWNSGTGSSRFGLSRQTRGGAWLQFS